MADDQKDVKTSTEVVKVGGQALELNSSTIKKYINANASDQEVALFLNQCSMFGLNPFKREIYLIKYDQKSPATFVVGYDVYLKRAERSGRWAGMESGTDGEGENLKAWVKVFRKDWDKPLYHEVYFSEYAQSKDEWKDGQRTGKKILTKFWAEKPKTMLKKVAIAQAFRMAFPDEFAGMPYTSEEMPVTLPADAVVVDSEPLQDAPTTSHDEEKPIPEQEATKKKPGRPTNKFKALEEFGKIKKEMGSAYYYTVLRRFGVDHANLLPEDKMREVYAELLKVQKQVKESFGATPKKDEDNGEEKLF